VASLDMFSRTAVFLFMDSITSLSTACYITRYKSENPPSKKSEYIPKPQWDSTISGRAAISKP
jgi:hypothetical protein